MAISYSRKSLGQTGDGHFSPIAGYCKAEKRILVLDVARFKHPSYWVSLADLFKSLEPVDKTTNQPRGYSVLRTVKSTKLRQGQSTGPEAGLLSLNFNKHTWPEFVKALTSIQISQPAEPVSSVIKLLHSKQIHPLQSRKASQSDLEQAANQQMLDPVPTKLLSDAYDLRIRELVTLLKASPTLRLVTECLQQNPSPLLYTSSYPQALEYILFLSSLLTSRSAPSTLRCAWRDVTQADAVLSGIWQQADTAGTDVHSASNGKSREVLQHRECMCMRRKGCGWIKLSDHRQLSKSLLARLRMAGPVN